MYRLISIVLFCLYQSQLILGQELTQELYEKLDSRSVEELTFEYYTEKNWVKTIAVATNAINTGIDYYYLRMRIGIACFELKHYREAEKHFLKALTFDSQSSSAKEYLYFCYINNEKLLLASAQRPATSNQQQETSKLHLNYIYFEGGQKLPQNKEPVKEATPLSIGLFQKFGRKSAVLYSFGNYKQDIAPGSHSQYQFYTGLFFPKNQKLTFIPAFHIISSRWEVKLKPPPNPPPGFIWKEKTIITKNYFYFFQLGLVQSGIYYDMIPSVSMLTVDDSTLQNGYDSSFYQFNFGLNFYPLKRNSLSLGNIFMVQKPEKSYTFGNKIIVQIKLFHLLKLTADYYFGNMRFNSQDFGYFLNNDYSITLNKYSIMSELIIKKRFVLYLLYQYETKSFYNDEKNINSDNTNFNYNNFIFGIKYLF